MSSPGIVFIVGMERCYTTSLAQWLVDSGLCDYFVEGIKEPSLFSSDPDLAIARWERERLNHPRWLLDASVCYAGSDHALDTIATVEDSRVIVCLRNQFDRMVSAYRIYRALYGIPIQDAWSNPASRPKLGDESSRKRLLADPLAPAIFRRPARGRHIYTQIRMAEIPASNVTREAVEGCDLAFAELEARRLPARVVHEWQRWERTGTFPALSVLGSSYFAPVLARLLERFEPSRIVLATPSSSTFESKLVSAMQRALRRDPAPVGMGHLHSSSGWGFDVPARDIAAARDLVAGEFERDTRELLALVDRMPLLDRSLFDPSVLFAR